MYIKKINLKNFRNYDSLSCEFDPRVNIIIGDNAQGKTNLIEAIYMSAFTRSFRTRKDTETIRFGCDQADIISDIVKEDDENRLEIRIRNEGKNIIADGKRINRMVDLLSKAYVVIFSPEDLKLVKESPDRRRRFMDQELSKLYPSYYEALVSYRKVLKQRNTYLKEPVIQTDILSIWDEQLAYHGNAIMDKRRRFIEHLQQISSRIHSNITDGRENLTLTYEPDVPEGSSFIDCIDQDKDILNRNTGKGPHRDDMKICIDGIDIRHFGSQGQQRTAALSLKLAEIEIIREITGETAILLLDDVLSELDHSRQEFLINSLDDIQVFITTTEISDLVMERLNTGKLFRISQGKVVE